MQSSVTEAGGFFIIPRITFVHSGNHTRLQWGFSCLGRMRRRCSGEMAPGHEVLPCVVAVSAVWNELTEATAKMLSPRPVPFQTSISVCSLRTLAMTGAVLCTKQSLPISTWCRDGWGNKQHRHRYQERIIQISKRTAHSHNPRGDFHHFHSGAQLIQITSREERRNRVVMWRSLTTSSDLGSRSRYRGTLSPVVACSGFLGRVL